LLRTMKSILGTSLIKEDTYIRSKAVPFTTILGHYFDFMRRQLCAAAGQDITGVVLEADVGGGTSDFSLVKLSPERSNKSDRQDDILANNGIHIGGTDVDRLLSLEKIMPEFGLGTKIGPKNLAMPSSYYNDLASWHRINSLYKIATANELRHVRLEAHRKDLVDRLIALVDLRLGHLLAVEIERSKIALSTEPETTIDFRCPPDQISNNVKRDQFNETIRDTAEKFGRALVETTTLAGIPATDVTTIFAMGGSISIPFLQDCVTAAFPNANFVMGDLLGSVGVGLSLDAKKRFQ
jgi:hypothetical chaperone protein